MAELVKKYQQYEEYKDSGVEWFKKIPMGWSYTYVGIVSDVIDPQPDHRAPAISQNGEGFPYIGIRDVNKDGTLNFETARPVEESAVLKQEKSFTIEPHNIIFCKVGTLGIPRKIMPHGRCALSATLVLIKAKKIIDSQFLLYILDSKCITLQTNFLATGSTRAALGIQQIRKFKMPFPTMLEQEKIANFLDHETAQIDTLIDKQQTLIQLLKEKRQAVISHAVTKGLNPDAPMKDSGVEWLGEVPEHWEVGSVGYYATLETGATPSRANPKYWDGNIPWIKTGEVKYDTIYDTEEKITDLAVLQTSARVSPVGTLLMAMYGQGITRGRVALLGLPAAYNQACVAITVDERVWNEYLKWFFIAGYHAIRDGGNETSQMNLNADIVRKFKILVPPQSEQKEIINVLLQKLPLFDELLEKANEQIQLMQERRTALISAAVTGKIDVRGWELLKK